MAQKSGFFNALINAGVPDRTYNADDFSDNLAVVISSGVLRSSRDDLKVTANGLYLTVAAGRAWIKGKYYNNTTPYTLPAVTPPTGGSRIDRVVLCCDNTITGRNISIQYRQGVAATYPVAPTLARNDNYYELGIAQITVQANATSLNVVDTRPDTNLCGWVYSTSGDNSFFTSLDNSFNEWFESVRNELASVTLFKRYYWGTTLYAIATSVTFNISQYDPDTCFLEVYVNGILSTDYIAEGSVIHFGTTLISGTTVTVYAFKSIDGTGIMSVADEITELQNQVAAITGSGHYVYVATGADDNISLSQIAHAIHTAEYNPDDVTEAAKDFIEGLGGLTWLQNLEADAQVTIEVVGHLGVTTPAYGSGTASSRYRYFNFSDVGHSDMRVMFDFAKADTINITPEDRNSYIIFYGTDLFIKNASVYVVNIGTRCDVQAVAGSNVGIINVENCKFFIETTGDAVIGKNGTFINCDCTVASKEGSAYCFSTSMNYLVRVIGGRYLAYAKVSGKICAVFYTIGSQTNAVTMAQNINCPTITYRDYWQQYLSIGYGGKTIIDGVVSTMNCTGSYNTVANQVWLSKEF